MIFFRKRVCKFHADENGAAAIEMAFVGMFISLMMLPLVDLADVTFTSMKLSAAINSSVTYAIKNPTDTANMGTIIQQSSGMDASKLQVNAANFCECDGGELDCNASCPAGIERYMSVDATFTRPLMFSYPGITNPYPVTRAVTVRVQ